MRCNDSAKRLHEVVHVCMLICINAYILIQTIQYCGLTYIERHMIHMIHGHAWEYIQYTRVVYSGVWWTNTCKHCKIGHLLHVTMMKVSHMPRRPCLQPRYLCYLIPVNTHSPYMNMHKALYCYVYCLEQCDVQ